MTECYLLQRLPVELRLRIYEHVLRFNDPIKLRQFVLGSRDLPLLRTNQQIYSEALPLLYDLNIIVVTRNDFCKHTDPGLKTPLKLDYARHLLMSRLSTSIACTLRDRDQRCSVCQPSAAGLIQAFVEMPRLQTVLVDYHEHIKEMSSFRAHLGMSDDLQLEAVPLGLNSYAYRLHGSTVDRLDIQFMCGRPG